MNHRFAFWVISLFLITCFCFASSGQTNDAKLGVFEGQTDVGMPGQTGWLKFDAQQQSYLIAGGGGNMWFTNDAFHFVWKKVSGDVTLSSDISFVGTNGSAHRKACLIIRQNLDSDCAYADIAVHGDGLTSLQYREKAKANTSEVRSKVSHPDSVRLEKHGNQLLMWANWKGDALRLEGAAVEVPFTDPFYIGLAVCAHDDKGLEKAVFSKVELQERKTAEGRSRDKAGKP